MARFSFSCASAAVVVALAAQGAVAPLGAQDQQLQRGQRPGPRFMVPVFKGNERNVGWQFADQLRSRLGGDFMGRTLWIIVKSDIDNALVQSGYSTTEPLNSNDARQLAAIVRADEYVEGTINKTETGYAFEGQLLLVRGDGMVEPLARVEAEKIGDVAKAASKSIQDARKPIDNVQSCILNYRQNKYNDAISDVQKALKDNPQSVMARVCYLEIAKSQKWAADSIIKIGEQVIASHPMNRRALTLLADAYDEKKMDEKYINTLTTLLTADPTNVRLVETVVEAIARTQQFAVAKPIIDEAVKQNPGDPTLTRMQYRIYLAIKDYAAAAAIGEDMIKADTASADTLFFTRQTGAYLFTGDTAKALETVSRGTAKFPNNIEFWQLVAQLARQSGQMPVALSALDKIVAIDPKTKDILVQKARILNDMDRSDEAMAALQQALSAGDDKATISAMASAIANKQFRAFQASKDKAAGLAVLKTVEFAEHAQPTPTVYFLRGATYLTLATNTLQVANEAKDCEGSKESQNYFVEAQIALPKAGSQFADQLPPLMAIIAQYSSFPDQMIKAYCK